MRVLTLSVLLLLGCDGGGAPVDAGGGADASVDAGAAAPDASPRDGGAEVDGGGPCEGFSSGVSVGNLAASQLDELSGLAASRTIDGLFYANNDSGDSARIFLVGADAAHLGTIELLGASHDDYEDIAVGPGPDGESWVHVGDIGDNAARRGGGTPRSSIVVYRFAEPSLDLSSPPVTEAVTPEAVTLTYPDQPHDCESLAIDPRNGDMYLLTKEDSGPSTLFVARAPFSGSVTLEVVTTWDVAPGSVNATGMDISPAGGGLLVRTYTHVFLFVRMDGEDWADALARDPVVMPAEIEGQGEAVAWRADGRGYFTSSEGSAPPMFAFTASNAACVAF